MEYMFYDATSFNQSLDSWDVSKVTDMTSMFDGASSFSQTLCSWYNASVLPVVINIFSDTSCADTSDPDFTSKRSFCTFCPLSVRFESFYTLPFSFLNMICVAN